MFDSIQANEGLLAPTNDFCAQPDPAAELQNICSGIKHRSLRPEYPVVFTSRAISAIRSLTA
jgi:hypothetical protein